MRTYWPTLVFILNRLCRYIVKYRARLEQVGGTGTQAALSAVITACEVVLALDPTHAE